MTFREQLVKLNACYDSLEWVGDKTIEQAWETCENSRWMLWFLTKTDLDLIDPVCDMAERVLYLVPEDNRLVCINAISAARRRANEDELSTAYNVVFCTARSFSCSIYSACYSASAAFAYAAKSAYKYCYTDRNAAEYYTDATVTAAADAIANVAYTDNYASDADVDASCAALSAYRKEQKNQCDIFRKYFTIDQVKEAFNKLVS